MEKYDYPKHNFKIPTEFIKREEQPKTDLSGYRNEFMRDRDRIMYSETFRRLSGKTQIYLTEKDDDKRNRLSHTLEVSQISRTISSALKLDVNLTEAIALGHDIGHTPFGHAGEQMLHEIMTPMSKYIEEAPTNIKRWYEGELVTGDLFGFKHNTQSIRVVSRIDKSHGNCGLNLTNYTMWGMLHHSSVVYSQDKVDTTFLDPDYRKEFDNLINIETGAEAGSFEAFVVAYADEIAQWHHDLEDALRGNALSGLEVCEAIEESLKNIISDREKIILSTLKEKEFVDSEFRSDIARIVVNTLVDRIINCSSKNLEHLWNENNINDDNSLREFYLKHKWDGLYDYGVIGFNYLGETLGFSNFSSVIREKVHHSKEVERMNSKGKHIIKKLFEAYYVNPQQLNDGSIRRYMYEVEQDLNYLHHYGVGRVRSDFEHLRNSDDYKKNKRRQILLMRHICDYIAEMTDRYAIKEYGNLYN